MSEEKTADEVALEYGLKLVERMAEQRDEARREVARIAAEWNSIGVLLTAVVRVSGGEVRVPTDDQDLPDYELNVVSDPETKEVVLTARPVDDDGEA